MLFAYIMGEDRQTYHADIADAELFVTGAAARLAAALAEAFPTAAPKGTPALWLDKLEPSAAESISELNFDRLGNINGQFIADALQLLRSKKEDRQRRAQEGEGDRRLNAQKRLEMLKPDPRTVDE